MLSTTAIIFYLLAYFFGSVNSAIILCKIMGLPSPRSIGSGNPGATNVMRLAGKKAAALTLLFDLLKGLVIVCIARYFLSDSSTLLLIGLFAMIGHIFPVFFKFKGGKGVATIIGALLGAAPLIGLCFIVAWLVIYGIFRISSLSALIALTACPVASYFLLTNKSTLIIAIMVLLVIARHHQNIKRLIEGKEKKLTTTQGE